MRQSASLWICAKILGLSTDPVIVSNSSVHVTKHKLNDTISEVVLIYLHKIKF